MEKGLIVQLLEKESGGTLRKIDERAWSPDMLAALHHVNFLVVDGIEYETIEGRLNVDTQAVELLLSPIRQSARIERS